MTGCARVPSPASSGWKSVPRKNGWSASSSARGAPSSSWAPKTTPACSSCSMYCGRDPVGAVVALDAAVGAGDPRDQRAGRVADRALVADAVEHVRARRDRSVGGRASAGTPRGAASSIPARSRARCEDRVLEAAAGAEERDLVLARGPDGLDHLLAVGVRAAGDDPDAVEAVEILGLGRGDPVGVEHEPSRRAERVDQQRDAPVGADGRRAIADQGELGGHGP